MRLIFGSDFHGNLSHYRKLLEAARAHHCGAILLGGDLTPRSQALRELHSTTTDDVVLAGQRDWFRQELAPLLLRSAPAPVFAVFGNSDRSFNFQPLKREFDSPALRLLCNDVVDLPGRDGFRLWAYPCVPASTHRAKDWERLDLGAEDLASRKMTLEGTLSDSGAIVPGAISLEETSTIRWDMAHLPFAGPGECERMVWMTHGPPHDTPLDVNHAGAHVGSVAIADAIRRHQPLATFHGHIHETVKQSGTFLARIGRTVCCASGNNFHKPEAHFVVMDLQDPGAVVRIEV